MSFFIAKLGVAIFQFSSISEVKQNQGLKIH